MPDITKLTVPGGPSTRQDKKSGVVHLHGKIQHLRTSHGGKHVSMEIHHKHSGKKRTDKATKDGAIAPDFYERPTTTVMLPSEHAKHFPLGSHVRISLSAGRNPIGNLGNSAGTTGGLANSDGGSDTYGDG